MTICRHKRVEEIERDNGRHCRLYFNAKFYLMASLPSTMGTIYCQVFKKLAFKTLTLSVWEVNKKGSFEWKVESKNWTFTYNHWPSGVNTSKFDFSRRKISKQIFFAKHSHILARSEDVYSVKIVNLKKRNLEILESQAETLHKKLIII